MFVVATAAVREAVNGELFIRSVEAATGEKLHVLTGADEAYFAGQGVMAGFANPDGVVGDLGGGSLELIDVKKLDPEFGQTFPLGGIRLFEDSGGDLDRAAQIVKDALDNGSPLKSGKGRNFYAVGGTWRSLAKAHIANEDYPLEVTHHYTLDIETADNLCRQLIQGVEHREQRLDIEDAVSRNRRKLLPYGAVVLREIIDRMAPSKIVFSTLGMREGYLFDCLDPMTQDRDPLIEAAREFAVLRARSPQHAQELVDFTDSFFDIAGIAESNADRRSRHAACYMEDVGWRAHPDYRGLQSVNLISNAAIVGVDHPHRVLISLITFYQHEGIGSDEIAPEMMALLDSAAIHSAKVIAALMRLAYLFSASMPGVLPLLSFAPTAANELALSVPSALRPLIGEKVQTRLKQLSNLTEVRCVLAD
jgi:exopolyphosphatase/guanosine-5'-triphosphate,3'-diphosphate pyrophosphatase